MPRAPSNEFEALLAQKRRRLDALLAPADLMPEETPLEPLVAIRNQHYLQTLEQLQRLRQDALSASHSLSELELELEFARRQREKLDQKLADTRLRRTMIAQQQRTSLAAQLAIENEQVQARVNQNITCMERLLTQKQKILDSVSANVQRRKQLEAKLVRQKEQFVSALASAKIEWAESEKKRKEKWEAAKTSQILSMTLKGIEPQIQRIVSAGQAEIRRVEQQYSILRQQFSEQKNLESTNRLATLKAQLNEHAQAERQNILQESAAKLKEQFEKLQAQYETDRARLRAQREAQVREIEQRRKREAQDFRWQDKEHYAACVKELRQQATAYETQVQKLRAGVDGEVAKLMDPQHQSLKAQLERYRQAQAKQLTKDVQTHHLRAQDDLAEFAEDLASKTAIEHEAYQSRVRLDNEQRGKALREQHNNVLDRDLSRSIALAETRLRQLEAQQAKLDGQSAIGPEQISKLHDEVFYLERQAQQWEERVRTPLKQFKWEPPVNPWTNQIIATKSRMEEMRASITAQDSIMEEKTLQMRSQFERSLEELEKGALRLGSVRDQEIARLRQERDGLIHIGKSLSQMRAKQREMIKKFENKK